MNLKRRVWSFLDRCRYFLPTQTIIKLWVRLPASTRSLPRHLARAVSNFTQYGTRQAAALSYYAVFSVFPLILLSAVAVSRVVGPTVAQEQIVQGLILFLPEETDTINLFQESVAQALQQSGSFTVIALLGLIWSGLGLFSNLTISLDRIFQVAANRSLWRQRLLAFLMTMALIILIFMSFITSGVLLLVDTVLLNSQNIWLQIGTFFFPFGLNMVIFVLLFRYVPARVVDWDAIWPAAILGSIAFELAKAAFAWYFANFATFQFVYGGITTVILLLLWAYLVACIFIISAEICSQINLWMLGHDEPRIRLIAEQSLSELPAEIPPPM